MRNFITLHRLRKSKAFEESNLCYNKIAYFKRKSVCAILLKHSFTYCFAIRLRQSRNKTLSRFAVTIKCAAFNCVIIYIPGENIMLLQRIKYFVTVVDCNSFTEAAEQCYISQSAISQQLNALETELGVKLYNRTGRKFTLTPRRRIFL